MSIKRLSTEEGPGSLWTRGPLPARRSSCLYRGLTGQIPPLSMETRGLLLAGSLQAWNHRNPSPRHSFFPHLHAAGNLITFFFLNINSTSPIHPSFLTNKSTMPRQRSVGRAPSRPTASAPAPKPQQARPAATMAAPPPAAAHPPPQAMPPQAAAPVSQGPGLFGQMASTAA